MGAKEGKENGNQNNYVDKTIINGNSKSCDRNSFDKKRLSIAKIDDINDIAY